MLVVGDLHGNVEVVQAVLEMDKPTIFIGDYVDSYDRPIDDQIETLDLVLDAARDKDNVFALLGNHELSYLYPRYRCSGWKYPTQIEMDMRRSRLACFMDFFVHEGILFTHAGVSNTWLPKDIQRNTSAIVDYLMGSPLDEFYAIGSSRGGSSKCGGPMWCDYTEEFVPIPGVFQVFGHSAFRRPEEEAIIITDWAVNVDCLQHANEVVEIIDGKVNKIQLEIWQ